MTEKECYTVVKTVLLPIFKNFISFKKKHSGFCSVLITINISYYNDVLLFIKKYGEFNSERMYWFKPYRYYPRYKLLKKAIKSYEENVRNLSDEYSNYLYTKTVIYPEFKKKDNKYPGICSFLRVEYGLYEIKHLLNFIIQYGEYKGDYPAKHMHFYTPFDYKSRRKLIKKAIKNYERINHI